MGITPPYIYTMDGQRSLSTTSLRSFVSYFLEYHSVMALGQVKAHRHGILAGRGRRPRPIILSYYINRIVSVCLFVCLSVRYLLLENLWYIAISYMDRSEIYQGRFRFWFRLRPDIISDVIVRKPDTGRKKRSKNVVFRRFFVKLKVLCLWVGL